MTNLTHLTEIIRNESAYSLRYERPVSETVTKTLAVYTDGSKSMTGKRGLTADRAIMECEVKHTNIEVVSVEKDEALAVFNAARDHDMIDRFETFKAVDGKRVKWVARIKA